MEGLVYTFFFYMDLGPFRSSLIYISSFILCFLKSIHSMESELISTLDNL